MDLAGCLNEILQVCPSQEIPQGDEFAVGLVFDVDDTPAVLAAADRFSSYNDRIFTTDNREGDHAVDSGVLCAFLFILLIVVVWVHSKIVEGELLLNALFEYRSLFQSQ